MADRVVVWAVVDTAGRVVTATEYRQNAEEAAGRAHLPCRIVKCVEPVESSGASPDREALAAVLAQCDADFARDLGAAPAELVGLAGKVVKAVHLRMADAVLSLLGATPREDARAEAAHVAAQIVTPAIRLKLGAQTEYLESAIRAALVERDNLLREVNDDREDLMGGGLTVDPLTARVNAMLGAPEPAKEPVMTVLGATPREDARDRVIVAAIKETESERNRALGVGTTKIDLDECRFERRRATEALLRFMIARKLGATEPAKEPDCELPCFAGGGDHRDVKPGEKCEGCGYVAPAPPVMDEAANEREVMPNALNERFSDDPDHGDDAVTGGGASDQHAEAAREAPEMPPGYRVEVARKYLRIWNGDELVCEQELIARDEPEPEGVAWAHYGRSAWANGDADAALLRECREYVATHGGIAAREHAQGLLARIDASLSRIGEPS